MKRFITVVFIILVLALLATVGMRVLSHEETGEALSIQDLFSGSELHDNGKTYSKKSVKNILLIGVDTSNEDFEGASSDSIILLSIDDKGERLILSSFMRDTYLTLPGEDEPSKLYTAIQKGGPEYLEETLEYYFGAEIENWALVNFEAFRNIIDTLGGIDLQLTDSEAMRAEVTGEDLIDAASGTYHLSGRQALKYCRDRSSSLGSDYDRTARQRTVIGTVWAKIKELPVTQQAKMALDIMEYIKTDMPKTEMVSYATKISSYRDYEMVSQRIPIDGTSNAYFLNEKMAIVEMEIEPNRAYLLESIYGIKE